MDRCYDISGEELFVGCNVVTCDIDYDDGVIIGLCSDNKVVIEGKNGIFTFDGDRCFRLPSM